MKINLAKTILILGLGAVFMISCGGGGGGGSSNGGNNSTPTAPIVETYKVITVDRLDIVSSTNGGYGYISFLKNSAGLSFGGFNTNDSPIAGFTGISISILKYPVTVGDTWSASGISNGYQVSSITVVEGDAVSVTVPAGTFTCVATVETATIPPAYNNGVYVVEYRRYFAPGVGLVKVVDTWKDGGKSIGELQAYSVTTPDPKDYFPLALQDWWKFSWI